MELYAVLFLIASVFVFGLFVGHIATDTVRVVGNTFSYFLNRQRMFSQRTFGRRNRHGYDGARIRGTLRHIIKECKECETDIWTCGRIKDDEIADLFILCFDIAWRHGFNYQQLTRAISQKMQVNEERNWPKLKDQKPGQPVEHLK